MKRLIFFAAAMLAAGAAQALGIGVRAGTTGIGADVGFGLLPTLSARVGYSAFSYSRTVETDEANYDAKLKLGNLNALLDWHPFGPGLRFTGGVILTSNRLEGTGAAKPPPGSFDAKVEAGRNAAPYLGLGFGRVAAKGFGLYGDFGVMFTGSPKATVTANCSGLTPTQCNTLNSQAADSQRQLEDDLKMFKLWPVVNIGLSVGW